MYASCPLFLEAFPLAGKKTCFQLYPVLFLGFANILYCQKIVAQTCWSLVRWLDGGGID